MGWLAMLTLAAATFAGLWYSGRCSRLALELLATGLLIACAGYAWQGSPSTPGNPVTSRN